MSETDMLAVKRCLLSFALAGLIVPQAAHRLSPALAASSLDDAIRPDRMHLDNGLEVWLKSRPGSGSISIMAGVKVGSRYETLRQRGLAHFVEHMVFQGTGRRSRKELDEDLKARGGESFGITRDDITWIGLNLPAGGAPPAGNLRFGLQWLQETLFDSAFSPERVAVARKVVLREREPQDYGTLWWRLTRAIYGDNSIVEGPREHKRELRNVKRFGRADLLRFYKQQYVPNNVVLAVVGDFDLRGAREGAREIFSPVPRGPEPPRGAQAEPTVADQPVRVAAFSSLKSSQVWCGYAVPGCGIDDASRLQWVFWLVKMRAEDRIREAEGRSYGIWHYPPHIAFLARTEPKPFLVLADCRWRDIGRVAEVLREELNRIRTERISEREVEMVRAASAASWRNLTQTEHGLACMYVDWAANRGSPPEADRTTEALTAPALELAARKYFRPGRFLIAYYRPHKTPRELGAAGALVLALSMGLVVSARRRNARLAPPPEHMEEVLSSHNTPRFVGAYVLQTLIWTPPAVAALVWLPWKLSEHLFTHAMFGFDFAFFLAYTSLLYAGAGALAFSAITRRVMVSRDGVLLVNSGFHIRLRADKIASVELGRFSMWRFALDPRVYVLGGDRGRWVIIKGPLGIKLHLAVNHPDQFVCEARAHLARCAVGDGLDAA